MLHICLTTAPPGRFFLAVAASEPSSKPPATIRSQACVISPEAGGARLPDHSRRRFSPGHHPIRNPIRRRAGRRQPGPAGARRGAVVAHLDAKYGERPVAVALAASGLVLEVLARPDGATWTIIVTSPQGVACLAAHGEGWQQLLQHADKSRLP